MGKNAPDPNFLFLLMIIKLSFLLCWGKTIKNVTMLLDLQIKIKDHVVYTEDNCLFKPFRSLV